jgi:GNAT superfamily N-acetyltransferase
MLADDPHYQRLRIGFALTEHATGWLREAGMVVAMVETGGDPGHSAARRLYAQPTPERCPTALLRGTLNHSGAGGIRSWASVPIPETIWIC